MGVAEALANLWKLARQVEELFTNQRKHGASILELTDRVAALEKQVETLRQREELLLEKARNAAMQGASQAMGEVWRRVGVVETRLEVASARALPDARTLPPPE